MLIRVNKEAKIVEIWLMNAEQDAPSFRRCPRPIYQAYRSHAYMPVVCMSSHPERFQHGFYSLLNEHAQRLGDCAQQLVRKGDLRVLYHG